MIQMLDLKKQYKSIQGEIDEAIHNVVEDTAFVGGKYVETFEKEFALYQESHYCIGVGNGTDALEIAIESLDLEAGSEIVVPANSFVASSEAVTRTGHKVVFCDCKADDYTICISSLRSKISSKTSAVIVVHLYGTPCDMDGVLELSREHGLKIIEDCAQAHGARYKNKKVGAIGDIGTFSFYPGKNLGAYGDGGAITTNNAVLAQRCKMISNHGRIEKYNHIFEGRNSRLDGLQAAILSVKLKYLDGWIETKVNIAKYYFQELSNVEGIILPKEQDNVSPVYHLFVIRSKARDRLQVFLNEKGIATGIHYPMALPKLKAYDYLAQGHEELVANKIDTTLLSLPIGEHLSQKEIEDIVSAVKLFK